MKFHDAINEIRNRVSIVDVIGQYVKLHRSGSNYMGLCPFHNEKTPSFSVNENLKIYKCFGCQKGGNVYNFLQEYLHLTFPEAVKYLAKQCSIEIEDDYGDARYKEEEKKKQSLYKLYKDAANTYYKILYSDLGAEGLKYFRSRNLTDATIKKFGLGFAPNGYGYVYKIMKENGYDDSLLFESKLFGVKDDKPYDFFYNRVMFPLVDNYGNVVGFQSRTLDPDAKQRKYVNSNDSLIFNKSKFLYAFNYANKSKEKYLILCEGNMDAITIHQAGFDNAVATMGTAFNPNQLYLIKRKTNKVYLCQDTDAAGIKAIVSSDEIMGREGIETYVIDLNPVKDADEFINKFGKEEFEKRLNNPIPTLLYELYTLKKFYNLDDVYEYEKYINTIVDKLAALKSSMIRDAYIKKVSVNNGLDYAELKKNIDNKLKGNKIETHNKTYETSNANDVDEIKYGNNYNVEKIFVYFCFYNPKFRDKIIKVLSVDEISDSTCKILYKSFVEGMDLDKVFDELNTYSDADKKKANDILNSNYDDKYSTEESKISAINELIRNIKTYNARLFSSNDIDSVFDLNNKINEIIKTVYIDET